MSDRVEVVVLFGGRSGEYEVSRGSAAAVVSHLNRERYDVRPVRITPEGEWVVAQVLRSAEALTPEELEKLTSAAGVPAWRSIAEALPVLAAADVVMPVMHGRFGEDGTLQGMLEMLDVPYVGNGVTASAVGMDKEITKRVLSAAGLPVAHSVVLDGLDSSLTAADRERLGLPVFVKPARSGSSLGVSRVESWEQLDAAIALAREADTKVLVEEAVLGREVDLGLLEHPDGRVVVGPALEIKVGTGKRFFDFGAKYEDTGTHFDVPAVLDEAIAARLETMASSVFEALGCSGLIRVDFLLRGGTEPVVNEVNTFPGFTVASQYPKIWEGAGLPYAELLDVLIDTALARSGRTPAVASAAS